MDPNTAESLAAALNKFHAAKVPPPIPYKGVGDVREFFRNFERYAESLYDQDEQSYLLVLPSFLEGESKNIVTAFGTGGTTTYDIVKDRVISEMTRRKTLGSNGYTDFFASQRLPNETLVCFSIRLEALAGKITDATPEAKALMTRSKFVSCLPQAIVQQMNVHFGNYDTATLAEIVRLASILEQSTQNLNPVVNLTSSLQNLNVTGQSEAAALPNVAKKCFGCGQTGHIRNECPKRLQTQCYKCNGYGHIARNCRQANPRNLNDSRQSFNPNRQNFNRQNYTPNHPQFSYGRSNTSFTGRNSGSPHNIDSSTICGFCNSRSHSLLDCPEFKSRFMACIWCGSMDHAAHLCELNPNKHSGNGQRSE